LSIFSRAPFRIQLAAPQSSLGNKRTSRNPLGAKTTDIHGTSIATNTTNTQTHISRPEIYGAASPSNPPVNYVSVSVIMFTYIRVLCLL